MSLERSVGEGLPALEERYLWELIEEGVGVAFNVGFYRRGDDLEQHIVSVNEVINSNESVTVPSVWGEPFPVARDKTKEPFHLQLHGVPSSRSFYVAAW